MSGAVGPRAALSEGLAVAGPVLGVAMLAGSVLVSALVPGRPWPALLLHASGGMIVLGGGVLLGVRAVGPLRVVQVGAAAVLLLAGFAVVLLGAAPTSVPPTTAAFPPTAVEVALIGFAAAAGRRRAPLLVAVVLVVGAEALCAALGPAAGLRWAPDLPPLVLLALVAAITAGFRGVTARLAAPRRAAAEAAEQDALIRTRAIARSRSAAVVHDGVLGDLAALAALPPGPLPPAAAGALRGTLELLAAPDWGPGEPTGPVPLPGGAVLAAVGRAGRAGLLVQLGGDLAALRRLEPAVELALGRAVDQCLANTLRHARVDRAEVTVLADEDGVSVMVADAGVGFEPGSVDADRLGLANSVGGRLTAAGGEARVFARPGVGTTVLLTVPAVRG